MSHTVGANGDIWKGGYNISRSDKLLDTIKEKSGMEVTKESAVNLRETADILEKNIHNFKM